MSTINFPASPSVNQIYTVNGMTWMWDGTSWKSQGLALGTAHVWFGPSAPSSPADYPLWWKSDEGMLKIYYTDVDSSAWVDAAAAVGSVIGPVITASTTAPAGPKTGDFWWKSDEGRLKVYYNDGTSSQWVDASPVAPAGPVGPAGATGATGPAGPTGPSAGGDLARLGQVVCSGSQTVVTFSAIPSTYTNLKIIFGGRLSSSANHPLWMKFNGDTNGSNYERNNGIQGYGNVISYVSGATGTLGFAAGYICGGGTVEEVSQVEITIPNYAGTTFQKSFMAHSASIQGGDSTMLYMQVGRWDSTAALTSITFTADGALNFLNGSVFTLYGLA